MENQLQLSEIPEPMFHMINGSREVELFTKRGKIKSIYFMQGTYRVYLIDHINGSGEYRFTPQEAKEITISVL